MNLSSVSQASVDVIIIAQNEELNIEHCISSVVGWARQVFVVDGFSTDHTAEKALACGALIYQHKFVDWADQRNWALDHLPLSGDWVFFLDADETVSLNFKVKLTERLQSRDSGDLAGFRIRLLLFFLGRKLKYAYGHPQIIRIIRRNCAHWFGDGAREYCIVNGKIDRIDELVFHADRRGLSYWIEKQNRNATREALLIYQKPIEVRKGNRDEEIERYWRLWLRRVAYDRLPLYVRPFLYFVYRYFFSLGFLEGRAGFVYCFLHGFWYQLLIAAKVDELRSMDHAN